MSIEVDLSALEEFAGKVHEAVTTGLRPAQDASADLMMTTGKSGIPGAATLFNWNSRVFYMTTVHNGRMASGGAALGLAANSVIAAYSDSDGSATAQMGAVQDAFYPRSDAYSLDDVLAEDAAAAAEREAAQQQAIEDAAAEVEFVHDGSTGTDSAFVDHRRRARHKKHRTRSPPTPISPSSVWPADTRRRRRRLRSCSAPSRDPPTPILSTVRPTSSPLSLITAGRPRSRPSARRRDKRQLRRAGARHDRLRLQRPRLLPAGRSGRRDRRQPRALLEHDQRPLRRGLARGPSIDHHRCSGVAHGRELVPGDGVRRTRARSGARRPVELTGGARCVPEAGRHADRIAR